MSDYAHLTDRELHRLAKRLQERPADVLEWRANITELRALAPEIAARVEQRKSTMPPV
jgi:hypothetical protein